MVTLFKLESQAVTSNAKTIEYVNYKMKTKEFTALSEILGSTAQARLLCHLENLHKTLDRPREVFTRNIHHLNTEGEEDGLLGYMKCSNRSLFKLLNSLRVSYMFQQGVQLKPENIDFQGKYYASYYLPSIDGNSLFWYRSNENINSLITLIKGEVSNSAWR
jgi:hypothetical protein